MFSPMINILDLVCRFAMSLDQGLCWVFSLKDELHKERVLTKEIYHMNKGDLCITNGTLFPLWDIPLWALVKSSALYRSFNLNSGPQSQFHCIFSLFPLFRD
jgi:hypothetical protein